MNATEICPDCKGNGRTGPVHLNKGDEAHEWVESMTCLTCHGNGKIEPDFLARRIRGGLIRQARVGRGESIMQAAERYGVTPSQWSAVERGQ